MSTLSNDNLDNLGHYICHMFYTCMVYDQSNYLIPPNEKGGVLFPNYLVNHASIPDIFINHIL